MKNKVVIIGYGFSTRLCIARSLGELGYEITLIILEKVKSKTIDCYSKYVKNYYFIQGNDEKKLLQILLDNCKNKQQKVILIPTNDFSVSVLDKNLNLLKKYFLFQHIKYQQGAIIEWMNKEKQKKIAQQVGLNIVNSIDIEIVNKSYKIPDNIHFPCFTKTREYTPGYKYTLRRCDNKEQLQVFLDDLCQIYDNLTLMVEDFKNIEKEYAIVGFSDGSEVVIPGVIEIAAMAKGGHKGVALHGSIVPCNNYDIIINTFKSFIKNIGFVGIFDIDFYLSESLFYFGELNLRFGGSGFAFIYKGINLPEMYARTLLGKSLDDLQKEITNSATYSNERICLDNWIDGQLTNREFFSILKSSDISTVKCKHDRIPEFYFWITTIKKYIFNRKRHINK